MIDMRVSGQGLDRFRQPQRVQGAIAGASGRFMRAQGNAFLKYAIQESPVGADWSSLGGFNQPGHPGLLRRSHVLRIINQYAAEVVNTADYAGFVARGTRPHMPPASSGLPWPVRREIAEHGTRAQPWFERAFELGMADVQANLDRMAEEILVSISGSGV